jgi:hypothetical protein
MLCFGEESLYFLIPLSPFIRIALLSFLISHSRHSIEAGSLSQLLSYTTPIRELY